MQFFEELKRRNVVRMGVAYVVVAWIVAQVAEFLFESFGAPDWVLQSLIIVMMLGLPFVLIFSWVFELTPEGVRRETEIDRSQSITPETGRRLNTIIMGALVLAVGVLLAERFLLQPAAPPEPGQTVAAAGDIEASVRPAAQPEKSIAVLPFVAMSASQDDEFFADGLSEELLNVLAQIDGLKVAGRTSSFYYKGRNEDLRDIADALGVANILEGSVRRSGNKLRITAQLIEAESGFHLWSENFERPEGDIFLIQDQIAGQVADALQARILGDEADVIQSAPANSEAQNHYLIAQAAVAQRTLPDFRRARDLYAKAAVLDPDNPRYLSGYAMAVALQYWNYRDITPDEAIYEAGNAIDKALELREPTADTLAVAGLVEELKALTGSDPNAKERALAYYEQAVAEDSNNILALQWLASIYLDINRNESARKYFERVVELDPLNTLALTGLANAYAALGRDDDARQHLYKVQSLFPELGMAYRYMAGLDWGDGRVDRATLWISKAVELDPNPLELYMLLKSYVVLGWAEEALEIAERYRESSDGIDISRLVQAWLDLDYETVVDEATRLFARTGETEFAALSAWANAILDQCEPVVDTLQRQYPSLRGEVITYLDSLDAINAVLLAHCNSEIGNEREASRLIAALLASELMSDEALASWQSLRLVKVAALAVDDRSEEALAYLETLDQDELPVVIAELPLPASELPVFENLRDSEAFERYAARERFRIAEQAKALASGKTQEAIVADIREAGFAFTP